MLQSFGQQLILLFSLIAFVLFCVCGEGHMFIGTFHEYGTKQGLEFVKNIYF